MFNDDVSAIPTTGCNVLNSQNTIYNYNNGVRSSYVQIGGRWIKNGETTYSYNPSGLVCITNDTLTSINSNAAYVPFYYMTAFILFSVSVLIFIKSIRGIFYGP